MITDKDRVPVVRVTDPDGMGRTATAFALERSGSDVRIMLGENFRPYGIRGDISWIPIYEVTAETRHRINLP